MEFITDRTESDVLLGNGKGIYSYTDLNRVERNIKLLAEELTDLGYSVNVTAKTDWSLPGDFSFADWPAKSQMERYLRNIQTIHSIFPLKGEGTLPKSMDNLTWQSANLIEKILQYACARIEGIKQAWKYSGEIFAGEE